MPDQQPPAFAEWCIVELLGHRRLAAHVTEVTIAGTGMLRLDEPATEREPARTQLVNPASIYALHPVTEDVVRTMRTRWTSEPISRWEYQRAVEERTAIEAPDADQPARERMPWDPDEKQSDDEHHDDGGPF